MNEKKSAERRAVRRRSAQAVADSQSSKGGFASHSCWDEISAIVTFVLAIFLGLSLASFSLENNDSSQNLLGIAGDRTARWLYHFLGYCSFVLSLFLFAVSLLLWRLERLEERHELSLGARFIRILTAIFGFFGFTLAGASLATVAFGVQGGGEVGSMIALPLIGTFSSFGAALFSVVIMFFFAAVALRSSVLSLIRTLASRTLILIGLLCALPFFTFKFVAFVFRQVIACGAGLIGLIKGIRETYVRNRVSAIVTNEELDQGLPVGRKRFDASSRNRQLMANGSASIASEAGFSQVSGSSSDQQEVNSASVNEPPSHVVVMRAKREKSSSERKFVRVPDSNEVGSEAQVQDDYSSNYVPPALDLLTAGEPGQSSEGDAELLDKSKQIESKLKDFGIDGRVTQVHQGPVITLYEFEPAAGVKVGRIAALQDDLAMSLRASSIRIVAPIPRRGTVGIEVPNKHRDVVRLRDVLESNAFVHSDSLLNVCVGKDTYGDPVVADISLMPHLLIAGATGTGKSVCINALLLSLLYRSRPDELGLILIDPKILELSLYEGVPHLKVPVVSHPRQAKAVLQWAVEEMNRRYRMMQRYGVRNLDGYNRVARGETESDDGSGALADSKLAQPSPLHEAVIREVDSGSGLSDSDGEVGLDEQSQDVPSELDTSLAASEEEVGPALDREESSVVASDVQITEKLRPLPKIIIVIDELADLMQSAGREIEELITRLAQKARASGIHLIVATQRPSVDVITGLIKANFPARLSFRVSSRVDSRTILDSMGADRLLGRGDMLLMLPGAEALRRVHGAFVSDSEVKRVVDCIKQQCTPRYDERIMRICDKAMEEDAETASRTSEGTEEEYDPVYDKAVELVLEKGHASTSMIQRVFRLGYNRAARIIETMEREGIVGPMDGVKGREVLLPKPEIDPDSPNLTKGS